ncbi:MAG: alpha-glucosidase C-terminal domain-containing protein, partial [Lachnospiraceae bacterium]|nr:alpha-glucosidase C-terminal domain-containing protein [Lachnospiraceae bacterium]
FISRDNARTPYQWDDTENAGFTAGTPWLKVNQRYPEVNLKADLASEDSVFRFYQKVIAFRKEHPAVVDGDLTFLLPEDTKTVIYTRKCARECILVFTNHSDTETGIELPEEILSHSWKEALTNRKDGALRTELPTVLEPWEASLFTLSC